MLTMVEYLPGRRQDSGVGRTSKVTVPHDEIRVTRKVHSVQNTNPARSAKCDGVEGGGSSG